MNDSSRGGDSTVHTTASTFTSVDDDVNFLDIAIVLVKHKWLIFGLSFGAAVIAAAISLTLPDIYTGTARIMPLQQRESAAAVLLGQLGGLASATGASLGIKNPSDLYVGMLKSRTVVDHIIQRFGLQALYQIDSMVDTRKKVANLTDISSGDGGLITIAFDDQNPKRAAAIANAYIEELEKLTQSLAVTEAAQRRLFFERQLRQAKQDLSDAEVALKRTQESTGLIKLDEQGTAIIDAVANLQAKISAKEVELHSMQSFATELNPDYVRMRRELSGLRAQLAKLERAHVSRQGDVMLPTGKVPEAGLEYIRKYRDVKYYEAIFDLLARQFEAAKIDEAKEAAVVQVVDRAIPADRKSKPRRTLIVLVTSVATGLLAILFAFFREAHARLREDPLQAARLRVLRTYLRLR